MSFEQDRLVEGGLLSRMHNGTEYREVRQFQSDHHLVRFYFVTRVYSRYMQSILEDFRNGLKPDVVIVNSCVWDISRLVLLCYSQWHQSSSSASTAPALLSTISNNHRRQGAPLISQRDVFKPKDDMTHIHQVLR